MFSCCAPETSPSTEIQTQAETLPEKKEEVPEPVPAKVEEAKADTSFTVTFDAPLGLAVDLKEGSPLKIKTVNEGSNAEKYNKENGGVLKAGLSILEVNGKTGTGKELVDEIKKGGTITLKLTA
mmetsp:Transcript_3670/g.6475  ORF Transcript_3670/g.6475 Transcript_3670/m.6475 type:complete len:124 (+) Transcript_3670:83-454(+)|eukprot:CAMPEP_0197656886 /NCGR_PEP_ID=MMETSP1338-20131121/43830_1 /TAXON_ID=43686 ORGANISM="Pelagodinium beii, Strain RCC1491" /NCGR_SAMPLE_ID=MMETSP1338 /ASSEMBLY_ACC=CAM_ASM_000754 /LENGTH=123 /DNA_ID=CAMNT_0043233105 /DNA_START=77 /DNA_END=448 /DNA_ORIENTATION=-